MPDETQVLFKSPRTGKVQAVPQESWEDQLAAGYTPVSHKVMYSTSGQRAMVPNEEMRDYMKQGYQTTPAPTQDPTAKVTGTGDLTQGAGTAFVNTLKGMIPPDPTGGAPILSKKFWVGDNTVKIHPSQGGIAQMGQEAQAEYQRSRAAGSNPIAAGISAGVVGAGPLVGVSNSQQQQQAEQGESGQILGESAAPAAVAFAAPIAAKIGPPVLRGAQAAASSIGEALRPMGEGVAKSLPVKLAIGRGRSKILADYFKEKSPAATETPEVETPESIQAELQKRRAAYAEMNEDFADRAKQQAKDMEKRIAASQKRISDAEEARQKEITDWAKVDKVTEADHQAFQDRIAELEQERQSALADTEKFRNQQAQDLMNRGKQQAAMDASHAQELADAEKARQGTLADQERFIQQHAEALNRRGATKSGKAPAAPPPNPFAGMTSTAPGAVAGGAELPVVPQGNPTPFPQVQRPGGFTPPPTPMPEPAGAPLSRPTVGSQIAAKQKTSLLSRGTELYEPGREPNVNSEADMKQINTMTNWSKKRLETAAKNGDRFAAFTLRSLSGKASIRP